MGRFTTRNILALKGLRQARQPKRDVPTSVISVTRPSARLRAFSIAVDAHCGVGILATTLANADKALYLAKGLGKNRAEICR